VDEAWPKNGDERLPAEFLAVAELFQWLGLEEPKIGYFQRKKTAKTCRGVEYHHVSTK